MLLEASLGFAATGPALQIRTWHSEDGLPSNNVRSVAQSADGYLWVATAEGVVRFDGVRFSGFDDAQDDRLSALNPRAVFAQDDGDVWIAMRRGGLLLWRDGKTTTVWPEAEDELKVEEIIREVLDDESGGTYLLTEREVFHLRGAETPLRVDASPELEARLAKARAASPKRAVGGSTDGPLELTDRRGRKWMRTTSGGLEVMLPGQSAAVELAEFSNGSRVMALAEDREGSIWVGTNGDGLRQIRDRRVTMIDAAQAGVERHFRAVMEDRERRIWAANKLGGVSRLGKDGMEAFRLGAREQERNVSAIAEDAAGVLWVSKNNGALFRFEGDRFREMNGESPVFRRIMAMATDTGGRMWLGGQEGLALWEGDKAMVLDEEHGLPREQVTALAAATDGRLWVGMAGGRVFRGGVSGFETTGLPPGAAVSSISTEPNGDAWVSTSGGGLFLIEKTRVVRFSKQQGLPDARLTCVLDDLNGYLWLGSLSGIFRVSKAELRAVAAHHADSATWVHLDRADGLLSRECVGGTQPAGWRRHDGTLLFPTVNGLASIDPEHFETNRVPPLLRIEGVRMQGEEKTPSRDGVTTGPGRQRLEFRFTALSLAVPEKVRFKTRLVGLDAGWQDIGTQRTAAYEAVPPGEYVFQVRAANDDGVWSAAPATLAIRVRPHFWETLWFQGAAALGVVGLAFGIGMMIARARSRMKVLRLQAQTARLLERERIAQDLHDDLGASLTEISLLAGLAAEETDAAKQQRAIPGIASKAQYLVSTLDEIVWAVNPRHDTLASFAEYVSASAGELMEAAGVALRLEVSENLPELPLDAAQRHALFLAAREALNNAVKHSGATEVRLGIACVGGELHITIADNGKGIASEASSLSEGLRNMRARLANIGGQCHITSGDEGTVVTLEIRVGRA